MTFENFFFLNLGDPSFIIFYLKDFDSAISLHLKCLPLSPVAVLVAADVYASIISPGFPLSIESPFSVNLDCIVLAAA